MAINWETPQYFFDEIDKEFSFNVDVCAIKSNAKISNFFTPEVDGLSVPWKGACWCNPPYDKTIGNWVQKAYQSARDGSTVVCLVSGRSNDTKWFHRYVMRASEIRFIKDRMHFGLDGQFRRANISSILVVFRSYCIGPPIVSNIDRWGRPCNKALHQTPKAEPECTCRPQDIAYYGCRCG